MKNEKFNKWKLVDYTDVWAGPDYWNVNNYAVVFDDLYMDENITDKEILEYLKKIDYITTSDGRKIRLINHGDLIEIEAVKKNFPIGRLELAVDAIQKIAGGL